MSRKGKILYARLPEHGLPLWSSVVNNSIIRSNNRSCSIPNTKLSIEASSGGSYKHSNKIRLRLLAYALIKAVLDLISRLGLKQHPEGGFFIETFRSEFLMRLANHKGARNLCTIIYYLLPGEQFSSFHTIKSDEIWHFYLGSSIDLHIIRDDGTLDEVRLGANVFEGEIFQVVVKANSWFAASVNDTTSFSLMGCTVTPGFDFRDWTLGNREKLSRMYPQHEEIIKKYTNA
jgi:predicted cupin superfamily sugar epimerase